MQDIAGQCRIWKKLSDSAEYGGQLSDSAEYEEQCRTLVDSNNIEDNVGQLRIWRTMQASEGKMHNMVDNAG
jgi:hypothetical protein